MQHANLSECLCAVPNGGRRDAITGARLRAEGVVAGAADLLLLVPRGGHGSLAIEMKTQIGRLSDVQKRWKEIYELNGGYYAVCRSIDDFILKLGFYLS
jgi:hypothetical protein